MSVKWMRDLMCLLGSKTRVFKQKIEKILITTSATITTDALKLAIENNIDVVF